MYLETNQKKMDVATLTLIVSFHIELYGLLAR